MNSNNIPTEHELSGGDFCLDTKSMLKTFLGKTKEEAMALCKHQSVAENFAYMSSVGLKFYLEAAFDYLKSNDVIDEDWDFPRGLLFSLYCQVSSGQADESVMPLIKQVADYCKNNTDKLGLDENCELFQKYIRFIERK